MGLKIKLKPTDLELIKPSSMEDTKTYPQKFIPTLENQRYRYRRELKSKESLREGELT